MYSISAGSRPARSPGAGAVRCRRRLGGAVALAATMLAGCTGHMDLTLSPGGTYDAVVEIRDTTGSVITPDTDCSALIDPAAIGPSAGAQVSATPLGSPEDDDGVGCKITITGVTIPQSGSPQAGGTPLVMRQADLYVVDLRSLTTFGADGGGGADPAGPAPDPGTALVDARVAITFPGAVVDADGGRVEGRTVTWTDNDELLAGVTASGYAEAGRGLSVWERFGWWIIAAVAALGAGAAAGAVRWYRRPAGSARSWQEWASRWPGRPARGETAGGRRGCGTTGKPAKAGGQTGRRVDGAGDGTTGPTGAAGLDSLLSASRGGDDDDAPKAGPRTGAPAGYRRTSTSRRSGGKRRSGRKRRR